MNSKYNSGSLKEDCNVEPNQRSSIMSKTKYDSNIASKENSVDEIQEVSKDIENLSKSNSEKIKMEDENNKRINSSNMFKRDNCEFEVEGQHHKFRDKIHNFNRRMSQFKREAEERILNYSRKSNTDFSEMFGYRTKTENFNETTQQKSKEFSLFEGTLNKHLRSNHTPKLNLVYEHNVTTEDTDNSRFPLLSSSNKNSNKIGKNK